MGTSSPAARAPSPPRLTITHKSGALFGQSQRDCVLQPRVARNELPWDHAWEFMNPEGVPDIAGACGVSAPWKKAPEGRRFGRSAKPARQPQRGCSTQPVVAKLPCEHESRIHESGRRNGLIFNTPVGLRGLEDGRGTRCNTLLRSKSNFE